jgi:hypothetical protein
MMRSAYPAVARAPSAIELLPLAALSLATLMLGGWLAIAHLGPVSASLDGPISPLQPIAQERVFAAVHASVLDYDAAQAAGDRPAARASLLKARNGLRSLLSSAPADPLRWVLLAEVEQRLGRPIAEIESLLDQSRATGPLEFPAVTRRIELAMRVWPLLGADARQHMDRDFATLLALNPRHRALVFLVQTAARLPKDRLEIATAAVERHAPASLEDFDLYRKSPPKEIMLP